MFAYTFPLKFFINHKSINPIIFIIRVYPKHSKSYHFLIKINTFCIEVI
ncbi:hypothetical protein BMB171_C2223 [Bacillus thuringiensis BMB171]|nr:hypothetical protein BMB171_C2223 [Bacillus thuringiensis BMB171]